MSRVVVIAAHPDDEVLGCGGTIARLVKEGHDVSVLILGEGAASRHAEKEKAMSEITLLKEQTRRSCDIMGVRGLTMRELPDNRFDSVDMLSIIKIIEEEKDKQKPEIIFTHHSKDLNIDHRITYNAVITACRPYGDDTVKAIYSFEVPSSTDWSCPPSFAPNIFFDISGFIDSKISALKAYKGEIRKPPHPRSEEGIINLARYRGASSGLGLAEAFEAVRILS